MSNSIEKLLQLSSDPISTAPSDLQARKALGRFEPHWSKIRSLLDGKNGFVAFESALHVFSLDEIEGVPSITQWNCTQGWRELYSLDNASVLFFAQDILATQFGLTDSGEILRLNPETGDVKSHSDNLQEWAQKLLDDYNYESGWEFAHEWQLINGPIDAKYRLLPKVPFVIGGDYEVENLFKHPTISCMEKLSQVYLATRSIPDGTKVKIQNWY